MRPGGRYDRTSYNDSRPGRHGTRAAQTADAAAETGDFEHDQGCLDGYAQGLPGCTCGIYDQPTGEPNR